MSLITHPQHAKPGTTDANTPGTQPARKALYRVPEAMTLLSLSRSVIYRQLRLGRLRSVKEGNARLIPADAIDDYVALLKAEAGAGR